MWLWLGFSASEQLVPKCRSCPYRVVLWVPKRQPYQSFMLHSTQGGGPVHHLRTPPLLFLHPPAPLHCGCLALGGSAPGQGHSHLPFHFPPTETIMLPYHLGKSSLAPEELGCGAAGPSPYIRQDLWALQKRHSKHFTPPAQLHKLSKLRRRKSKQIQN